MNYHQKSNAFATAAFVLAIIAVMSAMIIYIAVPLGALAILFALLSRGNGRLAGTPKAAVIVALCAMLSSTAITGYSVYRIFSDPELRARFEQIINYYREFYIGEDLSGEDGYRDRVPGSEALPSPSGQDLPETVTPRPQEAAPLPQSGNNGSGTTVSPQQGGSFT